MFSRKSLPSIFHWCLYNNSCFHTRDGLSFWEVNPSSKSVKIDGKLMDVVRRVAHPKLRPFHYQIKTYFLFDANYATDNPSLMLNTANMYIVSGLFIAMRSHTLETKRSTTFTTWEQCKYIRMSENKKQNIYKIRLENYVRTHLSDVISCLPEQFNSVITLN